jgi:hypothetical protein
MTTSRRLGATLMLLALSPLAWLPRSADAQNFSSKVCSFTIRGNAVASRQCRVGRTQSRVFTINYLADIPPGEVREQTVTAGQGGWAQGSRPDCLTYTPTGYTICDAGDPR